MLLPAITIIVIKPPTRSTSVVVSSLSIRTIILIAFCMALMKPPSSSAFSFFPPIFHSSTTLPSSNRILLNAFRSPTVQHQYRRTRLFSSFTNTTTTTTNTQKRRSRDKRREFIGMAKAVDRGQYATTYNPGGVDGMSFRAESGLPDTSKPFLVLGVESSCDDTGAAVVRSDGVILGESLLSQHTIHAPFGGVVPNLARNAHIQHIDDVIQTALQNANITTLKDIDAIGVTVGPGLEICLRVGCQTARRLAMEYGKPFVAVHHLEAHILMARMPMGGGEEEGETKMEFPFLALLVSGGHCQLLKCLGIGRYEIIGGTIDDSLGEAFDKTARLLGLPLTTGGGPAIEHLAKRGNATSIPLPIPMQQRKDCDFSYAGLKTSVRTAAHKRCLQRNVTNVDELPLEDKADIAASFQHIAIRHIEQRLQRAMVQLEREGIDSLAVVGGVAANQELRKRLRMMCEERGWEMFVPPPRLCTDQGSMSAWAAVERIRVGSTDRVEGQEVFARFPFADLK